MAATTDFSVRDWLLCRASAVGVANAVVAAAVGWCGWRVGHLVPAGFDRTVWVAAALVAVPWLVRPAIHFVGEPARAFVPRLLGWGPKAGYPCPECGYDIRMTPHRCPECGTLLAWGMRR